MPANRIQKSYLKFEIAKGRSKGLNEEDLNQSIDFIKTKIKYYTTFGFSVKRISFHYKTEYEGELDVDNLTTYERIYGETFDTASPEGFYKPRIESCICYEPSSACKTGMMSFMDSEEELEEIIDNSIVLSSAENGDPDVIADYVFVYLW